MCRCTFLLLKGAVLDNWPIYCGTREIGPLWHPPLCSQRDNYGIYIFINVWRCWCDFLGMFDSQDINLQIEMIYENICLLDKVPFAVHYGIRSSSVFQFVPHFVIMFYFRLTITGKSIAHIHMHCFLNDILKQLPKMFLWHYIINQSLYNPSTVWRPKWKTSIPILFGKYLHVNPFTEYAMPVLCRRYGSSYVI